VPRSESRGWNAGRLRTPAGPNLRALVSTWQEAAFVSFFRTGVDPYGRSIDPDAMPWSDIGKAYQDDELRAIYACIKGLNYFRLYDQCHSGVAPCGGYLHSD
jgi:hypothetical protein